MNYTERMLEAVEELKKLGHDAFCTGLAQPFVGLSDEDREKRKWEDQVERDAIREFWRLMQGGDAVLVMNLDKRGIKNYIGGNTLMEIGFAHVLGQKVFLLNPVPDIPYYKMEIEAVRPIVINGDYRLVR